MKYTTVHAQKILLIDMQIYAVNPPSNLYDENYIICYSGIFVKYV